MYPAPPVTKMVGFTSATVIVLLFASSLSPAVIAGYGLKLKRTPRICSIFV